MDVQPGAAFEATYASGIAGLVGALEVAIIDNDGTVVSGPTTAGIIENTVSATPIGVYTAELTAPIVEGQYSIVWSPDGSWDPVSTSTPEELNVETPSGLQPPPIGPPISGGVQVGPCNAWTTSADVAICCNVDVGSDSDIFDDAVIQASQLLFELSGRQFSGSCEKTVRPCGETVCGFQVLSRGHLVFPEGESWGWSGGGWHWPSFNGCGCAPLDRVLLSGYPVQEVTEVKIDGDVVDPSTYRLDEHRYLTRVRASAGDDVLGWPSCQAMDLSDTEVGTFSVTYTYGAAPPALGAAAATQLACEFYKLCIGSGECVLPAGTTRATRQGLTIDRTAVVAWAFKRGVGWSTSLTLVDAFLGAYNPVGLTRRPGIWSPDGPKYARPVG